MSSAVRPELPASIATSQPVGRLTAAADLMARPEEVAAAVEQAYRAHTKAGGPGIAVRLLDLLLGWQDRAARRFALGQLDDRLLRDVGLDQATARLEASKTFWRP